MQDEERRREQNRLDQAKWRARHPEQERANQAAQHANAPRPRRPGWPHGAMRDPVAFGRKGGLARAQRAA